MARDKEGHREYKIKHRVQVSRGEGPATAILCNGLPRPGDWWIVDEDTDVWAWCRDDALVQDVLTETGEPTQFFDVEQTFSTKPPETQRCFDTQREDPLLEPPQVDGGFNRYQEEALYDRFGNPVTNSAWELIRGPQNEWDKSRTHVTITQNVPDLQYALLVAMKDTVNAFPLWGQRPRCIKLSDIKWVRKVYGTCYVYYQRTLNFDIDTKTWDRDVPDEGTKVLSGHWDFATGHYVLDDVGGKPPDPFNPSHFIRFQDAKGNTARVILDGKGLPASVVIGTGTAPPGCGYCKSNNSPTSVKVNGPQFTGGYAVFNALLNVNATEEDDDPCTFAAGSQDLFEGGGTVDLRVRLKLEPTGRAGYVEAKFFAENTAPVVYRSVYQSLDANDQFDCCVNYNLDLIEGDFDACPAALTYSATCPGGFHPPHSGPPGTRHIEKYDESDFLLLGIPTSF